MARNIEIKARIRDWQPLANRVQELRPHHHEVIRQIDTFFDVPRGRLKLRDFGDGSAELIYYCRADQTGPKVSEYWRSPCPQPNSLRLLLEHALGVHGVVTKRRELYLVDQTRIHLDSVEQLGDFLELEVVLHDHQSLADGQKIARDVMWHLQIAPEDLISGAYIDLLDNSRSNETAGAD